MLTKAVTVNVRRIAICLLLALVLAACALAEEASDAPTWLDGQREALRSAQLRLIDLGLLRGSADGAYGPKTEAALRAYQEQSGLEVTGHLDEATLEKLTHVSPEEATAKDVQQRLIDLGYLQGAADGIIGPKSTEALKLFQRFNGQRASGKADADTLQRLFSAEAISLPATLNPGEKGEAVERLQRRLRQFGFMEADPDGSYGQSTSAAVKRFQQHLIEQGYEEGVTPNGVASPITQFCLYDERYSTYLRDVEPGAADSEALRLEQRLVSLGYMDMPADDVLDDYAISALKLFQNQILTQPDGLADKETFDALFGGEAPSAEHCAPHDVVPGDTGLVVREAEELLVAGGLLTKLPGGVYNDALEGALEDLHKYLVARQDLHSSLFEDPKLLTADAQKALRDGLLGYRTDDTHDETEALRIQRRLYTLFYLPKSGMDGKFGRNSKNALKEFQAANNLFQTGVPDEATQRLLFSVSAVAKPFPYRVEVSLDRQVVDVYELNDQGTYEAVQSFTCSTGLNNTTPRGVFLDAHPVSRWHHFKKFNCWAQYSFVITDDIMFHSVLYSSNNENSLRSGSLYALGNPASHGCVRLTVADAKWLFEHCKRGKVVVIIS